METKRDQGSHDAAKVRCLHCNHPEREAIDKALVAGTLLPRIAALYRAGASSLHRVGPACSRLPAGPWRRLSPRAARQAARDPFATLRSLR